ncbi:hypothetical protein J3R82DRAFT_7244 [Butyriboletus roseoflavus]|nr:hypothetical protein J3R82DRAFT_7244 [Butyriboletus roseoflavus]
MRVGEADTNITESSRSNPEPAGTDTLEVPNIGMTNMGTLADLLANVKKLWPLLDLESDHDELFNYNFSNPTTIALLNKFLIKYGEHPPPPPSGTPLYMAPQLPPNFPQHFIPQTQHYPNITTTSIAHTPFLLNSGNSALPPPPSTSLNPEHDDFTLTLTHGPGLVSSHTTSIAEIELPGHHMVPHIFPPAPAPVLQVPATDISKPVAHDEAQPVSSAHPSPSVDTAELPQPNGPSGITQDLSTPLSAMPPLAKLIQLRNPTQAPIQPLTVQAPIDTPGETMLPLINTLVEPPAKQRHQPSKHNEEANNIGKGMGESKKPSAAMSSTKSAPLK